MIGEHEKLYLPLWRVTQLEDDAKELIRAKALIKRLRAENTALKAERKSLFGALKNIAAHPLFRNNTAKKYGALFTRNILEKRRQL